MKVRQGMSSYSADHAAFFNSVQKGGESNPCLKTLPKALRTQALTALTSNFGLVGLVQYAWKAKFDLVW